jgi:sulfur-oxidizing protein SoxX
MGVMSDCGLDHGRAWLRRAPIGLLLVGVMTMTAPAGALERIDEPLSGQPGDPARGRAIVADRSLGMCLLCHSGPYPEASQQGTIAPSLQGAGARWDAGQLRSRIVNARALNPDSVMPAYFVADPAARVASSRRGKTLLDAQQIEDVVAFLQTLKTPEVRP